MNVTPPSFTLLIMHAIEAFKFFSQYPEAQSFNLSDRCDWIEEQVGLFLEFM